MSANLPAFPDVPQTKGRILIGGKLIDSGFETKDVFSTCQVEGHPVKLGTTPQVSVKQLSDAVGAA